MIYFLILFKNLNQFLSKSWLIKYVTRDTEFMVVYDCIEAKLIIENAQAIYKV